MDSMYLLCRDFECVLQYARESWECRDCSRHQLRLLSSILARLSRCAEDIEELRNTL